MGGEPDGSGLREGVKSRPEGVDQVDQVDEVDLVDGRPGGEMGRGEAPAFAVDVCVVESLLVQVTVPPTETVIGFGA